MGKATHTCSFCSLHFTSKHGLESHIIGKHKPYECRQHACNICSKKFTKSCALVEHIRLVHTLEKPYGCTLCSAKFATSSKLNRHFKVIHTQDKRFPCSDCDMRFRAPYDCKRHFQSMHTTEGQLRQKKKEEKLASYLKEKGFQFVREYHVDFSCFQNSYARIDFVLQSKANGKPFIVLLENDEGQHDSRPVPCEVRRMMDVTTAFSLDGNNLPIKWIRYNCDAYHVDGALQKKKQADRFMYLEKFLRQLETEEHSPFSIDYLFYDCVTVKDKFQLELFSNEEYPEEIKPFVQVFV